MMAVCRIPAVLEPVAVRLPSPKLKNQSKVVVVRRRSVGHLVGLIPNLQRENVHSTIGLSGV